MTFSLSIDRTSLSLEPLVLSGVDDANVWGVLPGWQMPSKLAMLAEATSPNTHGSVPTHWKWQQTLMAGDAAPRVDSTAELAAAIADLETALSRLSYEVSVLRGGVSFGTWVCSTGSLIPSPLDYVELSNDQQPYSITIPCHPVPLAVS